MSGNILYPGAHHIWKHLISGNTEAVNGSIFCLFQVLASIISISARFGRV